MSIRQGNNIIAGSATYHPDLFDYKWSDHILNNIQWLRADTFSWQNGGMYEAAFNALFDQIYAYTVWTDDIMQTPFCTKNRIPTIGENVYTSSLTGIVGIVTAFDPQTNKITVSTNSMVCTFSSYGYITPSTETVGSTTITYYQIPGGYKVVLPDQMSAVDDIYQTTGVAWYYILDAVNKRFKLPRAKHNKYQEIIGVGGNNKGLGIKGASVSGTWAGRFNGQGNNGTDYAIKDTYNVDIGNGGGGDWIGTGAIGVVYNTDLSGLIGHQEEDTDQYKYLYFYVGNFTNSAIVNTAGINSEIINSLSSHYVVETQEPSSTNNYTWYRLYSDGWVEQGGYDNTSRSTSSAASAQVVINFPKEFVDSTYTFVATSRGGWCFIQESGESTRTTTGTTISIATGYPQSTYTSTGFSWYAAGKAATTGA